MTDRFTWTDERLAALHELVIQGMAAREISETLSEKWGQDVSVEMVGNIKTRKGWTHYVPVDPDIKFYKHQNLPLDNYIISCDYHSPFYAEYWTNLLLDVARKFNVRNHIIVGDLFDVDFAKSHKSTDGEERLGLDGEAAHNDPLMNALNWFDKTFLICGNHETRISRLFDAKVQFRHISDYIGAELTKSKFTFSEYDKVGIGDRWLLVHPKSYSQISGNVAVRLAEKYHRNILNAHGHFIAKRWDRSNQYLAFDIGGMFDVHKIGYCSLVSTTHPEWNNGFGMLLDDYFYQYDQGTDWKRILG